MKVLNTILLIILLIGLGWFALSFYTEKDQQEVNQTQNRVEQQEELNTIAVNDAEIVQSELNRIGTLTLTEGALSWRKTLEDESWYSYRGIYCDLKYKFGIAVNLEDISITYEDDIVYIETEIANFFIQYVELNHEDSTVNSEASWLAEQYSGEEVNAIMAVAREQVEQYVTEHPEYWEAAEGSLKASLVQICNSLGYYKINFEVAANDGSAQHDKKL